MPSRSSRSRQPRIGITGGPGVGKSTVLSFLADAGYGVVSADAVARPLVMGALAPQVAALAGLSHPFTAVELRERLLGPIDGPNGADARSLRRRMNALLHGPILEAMEASGATFWEVPLLVEAVLQTHFDEVWLVDCGPDEQLRRLIDRYGSEADARALMAAHLPSKVKKLFSDKEVRTDQPLETVRFVTLELARYALDRLAHTWE